MAYYKCEEAEGDRVILTCDCVSECTEIQICTYKWVEKIL